MTTQSQQQQMAQPDEARAQETTDTKPEAAGKEERLVWGSACGAGAGAAILWQPVTVQESRRR
ncbi:hypothetical protein [Azospirillum ramasamyi]|uniref:Uncharacterized protein n=1 Tax=Azospirillum ramasamyi TaxID=682998 RepID=A0A2U9SE71_9PROT|nr:hypothetical protein [Azospirillum ramasamyi]AWU97694.1 hypothetical protein DM194_25720 [Azospirillum ramasamyi]